MSNYLFFFYFSLTLFSIGLKIVLFFLSICVSCRLSMNWVQNFENGQRWHAFQRLVQRLLRSFWLWKDLALSNITRANAFVDTSFYGWRKVAALYSRERILKWNSTTILTCAIRSDPWHISRWYLSFLKMINILILLVSLFIDDLPHSL